MEIRRRQRSRGRRGVAVALAIGGAGVVFVPACSDAQPPAYGGSGIFSDGGGTGNPDTPPDFGDGAPRPRQCNLGPDAGVCTCLDVPLLVDVPNLYFVLDRSGSMQENSKLTTAEVVIARAALKLGPRVNVGLAVFPDPITSSDNCAPGREVMSVRGGDAPAGIPGLTYQKLVNTLVALTAFGGTPTSRTLDALLPRVSSLSGRTYVILATDGGPNCDDTAACNVDQCIANIESSAPGCVPNVPPNCCDNQHYGPLSCLDSTATIAAVTAYKNANVPVYVIGVSGSGPYSTLLDQLAQAGGTARTVSPYYYRVDGVDEGSFQQALFQVAAKIVASCTLELKEAPMDPNLVNVFFDGVAVPQAGPDGWTLQGSTITLEGASCAKVLNGDVLDVNVSGGCPTVLR